MRMTLRALEVIGALMEAPDGELYGLQVMRQLGMPSGTAYPALAQMEAAGWITARVEDIDPRAEERPPRKYYRLTPEGKQAARMAMARLPQFHSQRVHHAV